MSEAKEKKEGEKKNNKTNENVARDRLVLLAGFSFAFREKKLRVFL